MVFPSPDPIWIVEILKVIVIATCGGFLLYRWQKAERHFFTDLPFLFACAFFLLAAGEAVDATFHSGIATYELIFFQFRALFIGLGIIFILYATVTVWFVERRLLGNLLIVLFTVLFFIAIILATTMELVRLYAMPFLLVGYICLLATFLIAYLLKRLPDVHGLVICIGGAIGMVGQFLKTPLEGLGIMWVSELIDLLGIIILALGLVIKPGYSKA